MVHIGNSWDKILNDEFNGQNYLNIREFLKKEYFSYTCYPEMHDIFNALKFTPYEDVRVVILGQDPYHNVGQAHGLCFSVKKGVPPPPSLVNIFKELKADLKIEPPRHGNLESWTKSGVLLLNTVLTVREGQANSHKDCGWQEFTDKIIQKLNERKQPIVFILWGANARAKKKYITNPSHFIIESAHPSPLSAYNGFFGSRPFSRANDCLISVDMPPVKWQIE
ncbi:MAG: uracil-DNA glycosylase [Clostridia bacterium]